MITSKVVLKFLQILNELDRHNDVHLMRVPRYSGVEGNKRTDCLTNRGAREITIGPEILCIAYQEDLLRGWHCNGHGKNWIAI